MTLTNRCCVLLSEIRTAVALLLLTLLSSAALHAAPAAQNRAAQTQTLDRIIAVVNDGVITQNQLDVRVRSATMQLHRQKVQLPPPNCSAVRCWIR